MLSLSDKTRLGFAVVCDKSWKKVGKERLGNDKGRVGLLWSINSYVKFSETFTSYTRGTLISYVDIKLGILEPR